MRTLPVTVIDLGTTKVACLAASLTEDGRVRVEGSATVGCTGMKRGIVHDFDAVAGAIDEAVSRVERTVGRGVDEVAVSISGTHLQSVNVQGFVPIHPSTRQIRRDDVLAVIGHSRQIVLASDREQIMAVPREFRIDGHRGIGKPIGMTGGRLEVVTHLVTGSSPMVANVDKVVTMAGRKVSEMVVAPLASGLAVAPLEAIEEGCVVVDIGGATTGVAVFGNGSVAYTACIPIGSSHVTSDLAALLKLSPDEAERLKTIHGAALSLAALDGESVEVHQKDQTEARPMQRRVLCEIIESRMREIVVNVRRQIEASGLDGQLTAGAFLTGGGSMLPAVGTLFSNELGLKKVTMAYPKVTGQDARKVEMPTMSTAVGLAKYCLESDEQEFAPVSGFSNWKEKIRTIRNPFAKKG